jgi:hypothetical protein
MRLVTAVIVLVIIGGAGCGGSSESSEVTVAEHGVAGVRVDTTYGDAQEKLGLVALTFPADGASGSTAAVAPLCKRPAKGFAVFWASPPIGAEASWKDFAQFRYV